MYGNPESIPSMDDCFQYESLSGRYLQIFPVEPVFEGCPFDKSDNNINPKIKEYYRQYNVRLMVVHLTRKLSDQKLRVQQDGDPKKHEMDKSRGQRYDEELDSQETDYDSRPIAWCSAFQSNRDQYKAI